MDSIFVPMPLILRSFLICLLVSGCASTKLISQEKYEDWELDCSAKLIGDNNRTYNSKRCQKVRRYERENIWPTNTHAYEYTEHLQTCAHDSDCQMVMTRYIGGCGSKLVDPLMYSTKVVYGKHRKRMLKLIEEKIKSEKLEYEENKPLLEECNGWLPRRAPEVGICWRKQCEVIKTWRTK